jgi:hypothetical protein
MRSGEETNHIEIFMFLKAFISGTMSSLFTYSAALGFVLVALTTAQYTTVHKADTVGPVGECQLSCQMQILALSKRVEDVHERLGKARTSINEMTAKLMSKTTELELD